MKPSLRILTFCLLTAVPVTGTAEEKEGRSLMEEGARLFFRGLMSEMEPALKELQGLAEEVEPALRSFTEEMGPAFADILRKVEDFSLYHPPEILPNGDIIMRRRVPLEPDVPAEPEQDGTDNDGAPKGGEEIEI